MKKGKNIMLHLLALLLLVVFLSSLSGFWLGYFLAKTITLKQQCDSETYAQEYLKQIIELTDSNIEDSEIVKNLTELIHNLSLDKTDYSQYNESIVHKYKREQHQIESEVNPNYEVHCVD